MNKLILVLTNNSDGLYGFRNELLTKLVQHNRICIATPDNGCLDKLHGIGCDIIETELDRRGKNPISDLKLLKNYFRIVTNEKPDIVITYTIKPNIYGGLVCRLMKISYAANITGLGTAFQKKGFLRKVVTSLYRTALKEAKVVFFENSANMNLFINEDIIPHKKCCLLSGAGVNLDHYSYTPYPQNNSVQFLFIGRVMKEKGFGELLQAMERLIANGEDCTLNVLGHLEEDFSTSINKGQHEGWLHYYGYQNDVRPYIEQAHCFVLPSYHEGMANTNLECAAMGRPIITSRIHGCMEAVIEGKSGLLCEPQNVDSLYEQMLHFCRTPNSQREAMGKVSRRHMEVVFDKVRVVTETITALNI